MLRKSIVIYLKSKKLKKRNANFMEVYQRISDELKERKIEARNLEKGFDGFIKVDITRKTSSNSKDAVSILEETKEKKLLKRKTSMTIEVEIPSFFNDRKPSPEVKSVLDGSIKIGECKKSWLKNCISGINF